MAKMSTLQTVAPIPAFVASSTAMKRCGGRGMRFFRIGFIVVDWSNYAHRASVGTDETPEDAEAEMPFVYEIDRPGVWSPRSKRKRGRISIRDIDADRD
jgi:hypothetical protein